MDGRYPNFYLPSLSNNPNNNSSSCCSSSSSSNNNNNNNNNNHHHYYFSNNNIDTKIKEGRTNAEPTSTFSQNVNLRGSSLPSPPLSPLPTTQLSSSSFSPLSSRSRSLSLDNMIQQHSTTTTTLSNPKIGELLALYPSIHWIEPASLRRTTIINYTNWSEPPTEIQKRNKYLEYSNKEMNGLWNLDFLIVLDSDEFIDSDSNQTNWSQFYSNLQTLKEELDSQPLQYFPYNDKHCHRLRFYDSKYEGVDKEVNRPRLLYQPWKLRYRNRHYTLYTIIEEKEQNYSGRIVEGLKIVHNDNHRPDQYREATWLYQSILFQQEERAIKEYYLSKLQTQSNK